MSTNAPSPEGPKTLPQLSVSGYFNAGGNLAARRGLRPMRSQVASRTTVPISAGAPFTVTRPAQAALFPAVVRTAEELTAGIPDEVTDFDDG